MYSRNLKHDAKKRWIPKVGFFMNGRCTVQMAFIHSCFSFMQQKPFVFIDKNGQNGNISGYSFDLLTKLSQQLKFKIVIREVRNISEMINELVNEVRYI